MISRQVTLAQTLGQAAVTMANASKGASRVAHRGLKPLHAKAVANATAWKTLTERSKVQRQLHPALNLR